MRYYKLLRKRKSTREPWFKNPLWYTAIIAGANIILVCVGIFNARTSREHLNKVSEQIEMQFYRKTYDVKAIIYSLEPEYPKYRHMTRYADSVLTLNVGFLNGGNQYALIRKIQVCLSDTSLTNYRTCMEWWANQDGSGIDPLVIRPHEIIYKSVLFKIRKRADFTFLGASKPNTQQYINAKVVFYVNDSSGKEYEIHSDPWYYGIKNWNIFMWIPNEQRITLIE